MVSAVWVQVQCNIYVLTVLIVVDFWPLPKTSGGTCLMRHLVSCPTCWQTSRCCNCIIKMCLERKFSLLFWSCVCFDFCLSLVLVNVMEGCLKTNVISSSNVSYLSVIFAHSGIAAGHQSLHLVFLFLISFNFCFACYFSVLISFQHF